MDVEKANQIVASARLQSAVRLFKHIVHLEHSLLVAQDELGSLVERLSASQMKEYAEKTSLFRPE